MKHSMSLALPTAPPATTSLRPVTKEALRRAPGYGGGALDGTKSKEIEFTQCRVFFGVKRSPRNTCPR